MCSAIHATGGTLYDVTIIWSAASTDAGDAAWRVRIMGAPGTVRLLNMEPPSTDHTEQRLARRRRQRPIPQARRPASAPEPWSGDNAPVPRAALPLQPNQLQLLRRLLNIAAAADRYFAKNKN